MRLAYSACPREDHILFILDKAQLAQFKNFLLVQVRLKVKIEIIECFDKGIVLSLAAAFLSVNEQNDEIVANSKKSDKGTTDNDGIVCKPDAGELIEKKEIPQNVVEVSSGLLSKKLLELAKAVAVCETENSHVREAISERDREIICVVVDKRIQ